jgi:hypothetical protein
VLAERARVKFRSAVAGSALVAAAMQDPPITTELLDHLPASGTVPTPLMQYLSNRALTIGEPLGRGHVVMFALRPFWRWQTQGTYFLGFNAILNWNDLDAGKASTSAGWPNTHTER